MPPIFIVPMPTVQQPQQQQQSGAGGSNNNAAPPGQRSSFRPPWVKDGPAALPMPTAPWTLARARDRRISRDEPLPNNPEPPPPVRKQSKITIIPSQPNAENGVAEAKVKQEVISAAAAKKQDPPPKERKIDIQTTSKQTTPNDKKAETQAEPPKQTTPTKQPQKPQLQKQQTVESAPKEKKIDIQVQSTKKEDTTKKQNAAAPKERKLDIQVESKQSSKKEEPAKERKIEIQRKPSTEKEQGRKNSAGPAQLQRKSSETSIPPKPPAPPMPPPPPPGMQRKTALPPEREAKLDTLRSRPRKRPDWGTLMKEVESGRKLKHVQCNDRSTPLLPKVKATEGFLYESEKPNVHNRLLQEIQGGVNLKRVQCNDRSKPILEGLRKFRRQMTIEEQMHKAEEQPVEAEPDELDDIDKVRDDLQSTKQMLALELRNKEAVERENKRLLARILNLEVDMEKQKIANAKTAAPSAQEKKSEEEKMVVKLKDEVQQAQKQAHEMEEKYHETVGELDMVKADLEEERRKIAALEKKLANAGKEQPLMKQPSAKKIASMANIHDAAGNATGIPGQGEEESESEYEEYTETEEEEEGSSEDEEKAAALREKRIARELKLLNTKVYSLKEKEDNARKERRALRMQMKNQQTALRTEKKKYKVLQKEVDKMSKLMNDDDEEEEEEDDEEEESEEEESEESSSEESGEESEGDLPPEAPVEDRKKNYTERAKKHENILSVLRKGNYLLKANVDKLKDDLFKQKEMSLTLQEDLNSVLAELG